MYFDPLEFPLLDGTLIPPPQQIVPSADELKKSGAATNEVVCDGASPSSDPAAAVTADGQEQYTDDQAFESEQENQEYEEEVAAEAYDAYSDPSLPVYMPRDSRGVVDFSHHRRKCLVCRHAYRALIEHDYLSWRDPGDIAADCGFRDARPILRHAQAVGLDRKRARRVTGALERLIQKSSAAAPSAGSIVSAIKLYAQMTGSWTPPPRQVVVTHVRQVARDDARHGAAHSVPDGVYHGERHGVPYGARENMRPAARDGVQQSVPEGFPHGACGDASNSAPADRRPSARNRAGNAAQQRVPHDRRQSAGDGVRDDVSDDLRRSVGAGVGGEARHGVDEKVERGARREWRDEVANDDRAATHSDSAVVRHQGTAATGPDRAGGEAAAPEPAAPPEVPAPTEASTAHPEFQGGSLQSLAPATQISNQLPRRLEIEVSP
jgi:hypothetical protein